MYLKKYAYSDKNTSSKMALIAKFDKDGKLIRATHKAQEYCRHNTDNCGVIHVYEGKGLQNLGCSSKDNIKQIADKISSTIVDSKNNGTYDSVLSEIGIKQTTYEYSKLFEEWTAQHYFTDMVTNDYIRNNTHLIVDMFKRYS